MTILALIRHAPTTWNAEGRLQGRRDTELSKEGEAALASWTSPKAFSSFDWIASPLGRCGVTARSLRGRTVPTDNRIIEMDWGDWEGRTRAELSTSLGSDFHENETRGLDFTPPAGESPRMVQTRLTPFLQDIAKAGRPTVAVTHRGVIRAMIALATGWNFMGKPPVKGQHGTYNLLRVSPDGGLDIQALDVPLDQEPLL
ncbi:MAG: histidine phosphatase family protein [Alphaproteobacteria bacterium]|jgi:broad specificity phosphatase PhoE